MRDHRKKLLDPNNPENTIVRVVFRGSAGDEYECAGVLVREERDVIRVAFNAVNDDVVDFLDINREDLIDMQVVDPVQIAEIQ